MSAARKAAGRETACPSQQKNDQRGNQVDEKRDARTEEAVEQPSHDDPAQQARSAEHGRAQRRLSGGEAAVRQQRGEVSDRSVHADRTHEKDGSDNPERIRAQALLPSRASVLNRSRRVRR
jgi:hypothetical protein